MPTDPREAPRQRLGSISGFVVATVCAVALSACASTGASHGGAKMVGNWNGEATSTTVGIPYTLDVTALHGPSFRGALITEIAHSAAHGEVKSNAVTIDWGTTEWHCTIVRNSCSGTFEQSGVHWGLKFVRS